MPVRRGSSSGSVPYPDLHRFVELFKSFQSEVKASKSVKRFKSYGHLKFSIYVWGVPNFH